MGVLLLHASHFLRMVRAAARAAEAGTVYGWEVVLDPEAGAPELQHALAALSVACRLSAREVPALEQDDGLARRYLTLRGWYSDVLTVVP